MRRILIPLAAIALTLVVGTGCATNIPPKLQVRDVGSGRTYTTYQPWGTVEKGVGYGFTDAETGRKIMLTNYEISTVEAEKTVPGDSPEAKSYEAAKTRGGVK
jgi:hypothetical protein